MDLYRASDRTLIPRSFYERDPVTCARELIGTVLSWDGCRGRVVETEAYDSEGDEACHTFFKPSARAFVQAHPPGTAYVYLNYGVHWMLNVLVKGDRHGFVLFRALEPLSGLAEMRRRRGTMPVEKLCSGPGKLTQALGIDGRAHGADLCADGARGFHFASEAPAVRADGRIGINRAVHFPWRFTLANHPHISARVKSPIA
ncbi:MAG TPA: DNA-3-methyladenine glycosylase [Chthoniobacterales bacterium]